MKITLLDCPISKHGRYHLVYGLAAWPKGTRHNRGWDNARVFYERQAHPDEVKEQETSYRFICWTYADWDVLVADEAKFGVDANTLRDRYYKNLGQQLIDAASAAPYTCIFCGAPSWIDPSDQVPPPDYCNEEDHGTNEDRARFADEAAQAAAEQAAERRAESAWLHAAEEGTPSDWAEEDAGSR